jgi:ferritin-like metal-binding protein YciE
MNAEQKIVQYLTEAHATESALLQTLTAHIAITPRSEYRSLLERHADETREQAERILGRLADLGETRNPVQLVYGVAQTAVGQLIAAGKFPLDLLRGSGGEEKLLKNAKDEAASEALEIATYDALEALAQAAGDDETAELAREHREQEEAFLRDLRAIIPQLTRDVFEAEVEDAPSVDVSGTGAVEAARTAATQVRSAAGRAGGTAGETVEDAADRVSRRARETARRIPSPASPAPGAQDEPGAGADDAGRTGSGAGDAADLPIEGYDDLTVEQVLPKLRLLSADELARLEGHERDGRARKRVLERIGRLREQSNGRRPAPAR